LIRKAVEVFGAFLRLGLTSFGGPVAHIGYFEEEFVRRRKWLDSDAFAQVVALCQFLPGPASSQVGIIIGTSRAGVLGGALAWLAFTLPSAIALAAFGLGVIRLPDVAAAPWIHGLLVASVAVVALAVTNMYRSLCPDQGRKALAFAAAAGILLLPSNGIAQLAMIAVGAAYGLLFVKADDKPVHDFGVTGNKAIGVAAGAAFALLLLGLPVLAQRTPSGPVAVFSAFYESGALVFGGGHVILPLLQTRVVPQGWVSPDVFLAGYGATQAMPGPLSTFAAFLGAAMHGPVGGVGGAAFALFAIYLPSFLLLAAIVPFWSQLMRNRAVVAAVGGVNAAVVGVLLAALYTPVWTTAIRMPSDVAIALGAFALLAVLKLQPWTVVLAAALASQIIALR
jgi:chromate transporter